MVRGSAGWRTTLAERWDGLAVKLKIAMVGKYTGLSDAYLSVLKALQHACLAINRKLEVQWIEASDLEDPGKVCCIAACLGLHSFACSHQPAIYCHAALLSPFTVGMCVLLKCKNVRPYNLRCTGRTRSARRTARRGHG